MLDVFLVFAAGLVGFLPTRGFVRRRLRFVDAVHSRFAPPLAGAAAALIAWPLAALPLVTAVTTVAFGFGVALGVASGARALRHAAGPRYRLSP